MDDVDHQISKKESMERTSVLANERTYAAWIRTGLTALATGLGSTAFLRGVIPKLMVDAISLILLFFSAFCFYLAASRYRHVGLRMVSTHVSGAPTHLLTMLSMLLIFAAILALIGTWM